MTPEATAALIGAGIGAVATLGVGWLTRLWASQDARARSRRDYVLAVSARLQRMVNVSSPEDLRSLNNEMFGVSLLAIYVPRFEGFVHAWYALQDVAILDLALASHKGNGAQQAEVFAAAVDAMAELRGWSRRELARRPIWFWWQLRTTHREQWRYAKGLHAAHKKQTDARREGLTIGEGD